MTDGVRSRSRSLDVRSTTRPLPEAHKLHASVAAKLGVASVQGTAPHALPWAASFFGLDRVRAFSALDVEARESVVRACGRSLLVEAQGIERLGLTYCAKMSLLSETTEERVAYSLMAADEAIHLALVSRHVEGEDTGDSPFLALLREAIEERGKNVLTLLIQVVLEGWGLTHYRRLAEGCQEPLLEQSLRRIRRDEAFHHGSGNLLFSPAALGGEDETYVVEFLARVFRSVQIGPQSVAGVLERAHGGLTREGRAQVFAELDTEADGARKIGTLHALLLRHDLSRVREALERRGVFTPFSPEACAAIAFGE